MKQLTLLICSLGMLVLAGCERTRDEMSPDCYIEESQDAPLKGYELYTWSQTSNKLYYALLIGTNRLKAKEEILQAQEDIKGLKKKIESLPDKTSIYWNFIRNSDEMKGIQFTLPDEKLINTLKEICKSKGTHLEVNQ